MIPDSRHQDEIGRLQNHFQQMQLSLANNMPPGDIYVQAESPDDRGRCTEAGIGRGIEVWSIQG
jgi:hypothetical protein